MRSVEELLGGAGVLGSWDALLSAKAISHDGRYIAGVGRWDSVFGSGERVYRAFLPQALD